MDFFTRGYNAFLSDKGQPQSADETIEKLADCVQHATLLEDRRAGVLSLKGLARDWTEKVGEKGLPGLIKVLHEDYKDTDTTKAVLETITILCTQSEKKSSYALNFTDQFIKYANISSPNEQDAKNVTVLLDILEEFDFYVRFNTVKLLVTLLYNRSDRIQECILTSPIGITRLIELLDDKREIIRNEGLLLLISLTETNADIQKIVAFGNTFERLLAIIEEEEGISGGIIVQDSLSLTHNLLRYNVSNQNYFRETSCIQQIPGLLGYVGDSNAEHVPYSFEDWPPQKVANTILVLQLIHILTEPAGINTAINQKVMTQSGILLPVVQLALCSNAPARVRTEALYAIAYLVCANEANQTAFIKTIVANQPNFASNENGSAPPNAPRPALVALISIAVANDTQNGYALSSRAAAAYAATCCIDDNPDTQLVLAGTLHKVPEDNVNSQYTDKPHSAGSLILDTLETGAAAEKEPYAVWFACVIMSHIINGNDKAKELAAKVTFGEESEGEEPVPLLHQIMAALMSSSREPSAHSRAPFGYLCLLCVWLFESPSSVKQFLSESIHVQFLIEEMQKTNVDPVVQGLAAFLLGIAFEYNDDEESELSRETLRDILLNRVGADQFKNRLSRLRDSSAYINVSKILYISTEEDEAFNLNGSLPMLVLDYHFVELFKESYDSIQRAITRDPKTAKPKNFKSDNNHVASSNEIQSYKEIISKQDTELKDLKSQIANLQNQVQQLMSEKQAAEDEKKEVEDKYLREQARFATLEKEQEDLLVCMGEQDLDIQKYRDRLKELGQEVTDNEEEDDEEE